MAKIAVSFFISNLSLFLEKFNPKRVINQMGFSVASQKYVEDVLLVPGRARVSEELYSGNLVLQTNHIRWFEMPLYL
jgi:hypothetical protein